VPCATDQWVAWCKARPYYFLLVQLCIMVQTHYILSLTLALSFLVLRCTVVGRYKLSVHQCACLGLLPLVLPQINQVREVGIRRQVGALRYCELEYQSKDPIHRSSHFRYCSWNEYNEIYPSIHTMCISLARGDAEVLAPSSVMPESCNEAHNCESSNSLTTIIGN